MLKLTVSLIARRVPWRGDGGFATVSPPPHAATGTPLRAGPARGPGEALSFLEREIEFLPSLPEIAVPLATYTGWNLYREPFPQGELCDRNGSYKPFARTQAEREAAADPRPSLAERSRRT